MEKKISNIQEELSKIEQKFNNRFNLQNNLIDEQKIIIDTNNRKVKELNDKIKLLNDNILYKDIAFEKNEEEIKKLKKNLSYKNKELKQIKTSLNDSKIKINNQSSLLIKNSQLINKLKEEVDILKKIHFEDNNQITKLKMKLNEVSNKIDLIGCRDFLRIIILDFCDFLKVKNYNNFREAASLIKNEIKKKIGDSSLQEFVKKVNLIRFIENLGKLIDDSDILSHLYFKELSIKYRNKNIKVLTNVENIKKNINKCKDAFNEYAKINFDSIFSFFINDLNYPYFILNNSNIDEKEWFDAIKRNIKKNNY